MAVDTLEKFVGQMTVAELCRRSGRSVEELLRFCSPGGKAKAKTKAPRVAEGRVRTSPKAKKEGRGGKLDERVMKLVVGAKDGIGGRGVADSLGESLVQVRAALKRLIVAKRVRFAGATRARKYWAV